MKEFTDSTGRKWTVEINVAIVKRIKSSLQIDLLDVLGDNLIDRLSSDPILLCDLLYVTCKDQADAEGITDEQFGKAMAGDAIDGATEAFLNELVDFFPKGRRGAMRKVLDKTTALQARAIQTAETMIDSGRIDRMVENRFAKMDQEIDQMLSAGGN